MYCAIFMSSIRKLEVRPWPGSRQKARLPFVPFQENKGQCGVHTALLEYGVMAYK